jgi:LPS-assembly protein
MPFSVALARSTISTAFFSLLLFCAAGFFTGMPAHAASSNRLLTKSGSSVLISADSTFGDYEKQTMQLTGNVQITFDGQNLRADRAVMDKVAGRIIADGNVILASPSAYVEGSHAEISYEDSTGIILDGFVKAGQVLFEGKRIRKLGPDLYEADEASFTACTTCPPAWQFKGTKINAEMGAYARIKDANFYFGGQWVFWLPYLVVPLKSERQSGVLFPTYDIDVAGFGIGLPVFWAISRSQDMTFTPKWYMGEGFQWNTGRGFKGLINYRYVLNQESAGEMNVGGLLKDKVFGGDTNLSPRPGDERSGRWFINHDHMYTLPGGFINRARLALVSDLRYTRDFPEEMKGLGDPSLENTLSLTKNTELTHSSIEAAYYVNQLKTNPLEGNADAVHRFPEIKQSGVDRSLFNSRVFLRWDVDYTNFTREDFAFDDVVGTGANRTIDRARGQDSSGTTQAGSGTFEPGSGLTPQDVLRTGQRLDLKPEISAPFRIGKYLDVLPSIQFRHTQYEFNVTSPAGSGFESGPSRQYIRGRLAIRTQISRVYDEEADDPLTADGLPIAQDRLPAAESEPTTGIFQALQAPIVPKKPTRIKHEIEPEIAIQGLPYIHQTDSPFFGDGASSPIFLDNQPVSNADFYSKKGLQFDYEDRITQRNIISALVTNRFIRKTWNGDTPVYRQFISIKNGTSYEYDKTNGDGAANFSDIFTVVDARLDHFDTNTSVRFFPLHRVFNTSSRARVSDAAGKFLELSFSQNYLITENVAEAYPAREENIGFAFGFVHRYATVAASFNYLPATYSPIDLRLKSWSADLIIRPPGNCWGAKAKLTYVLGETAPHVGFDFSYDFSGAI